MKINYEKTKENFDAACLSQSKVSRTISVDKTIFSPVLNGVYPFMGSKSAQKVINKLRALGVLVEEPEDQAAA